MGNKLLCVAFLFVKCLIGYCCQKVFFSPIDVQEETPSQNNNSDVKTDEEAACDEVPEGSSDHMIEISITDLPIEIIVHIYDFLTLVDRHRASLTCRAMFEAFSHPKLWREQNLSLLGNVANYRNKHMYTLLNNNIPEQSRHLIEKFGKYFQHLKISVIGYLGNLEDWSPVLLELSQQCRLEKLTLQIGKVMTFSDLYGFPPSPKHLKVMLSFIENAFRMKHLDLKSWPIFHQTMQNDDQNIFKALIRNSKIKELEKLDLFLPYNSQMWAERQPILPPPGTVINLIQHFENLQVLGLRSPMLSDELLLELADSLRPGKMKLIYIFVTFSGARPEYKIPTIQPSTWKKLVANNPAVTVECKVMPRVPNLDLGNMLTIECPLSKIEFLEYARIDEELIFSLASKYNRSLCSFKVYCEMNDCDEALLKLVDECKLLDHLIVSNLNASSIVYNCSRGVNYKTVRRLASMRGEEWKMFIFNLWNISFEEKSEVADDDDDDSDDTVIAKNDKGEYYLVGLRKFHSNNLDKESTLQRGAELKEIVESILGPKYVKFAPPTIVGAMGRKTQ